MAWVVSITDDAKKALKKLSHTDQGRLLRYMRDRLQTNLDPRPLGKPLQGIKSGLWRWRVGNYRIVGRVDGTHLTILIVDVGHRSDVYA